jgi:hypothetical protein
VNTSPASAASASHADLPKILVSWNGSEPPFRFLQIDAVPAFEFVLFDYSGQHGDGARECAGLRCHVLSAATECKGEIYARFAAWLLQRQEVPEYVALIDDDVLLTVGGINHAMHIARCTGLDVFSPALSHDSVFSHRWTLHQPHRLLHDCDWVEVMMPFYRGALFVAGAALYEGNVSSWGIDRYLMTTLQKLMRMERTAIVDAVMASHLREITSGNKVFRNGLSAPEEEQLMRQRCIALLREREPALLGSAWYRLMFEQRRQRTRRQRIWLGMGRRIRQWLDRST